MSPEDYQRLIFGRLLSAASLATVSIISARPRVGADGVAITDTAISDKIQKALAGLTTRGGKNGASIEVGMPNYSADGEGAQVNQGVLSLPVFCRENPLINMGATGSGLSAERIALLVMEVCNQLSIVDRSAGKTSASIVRLPKAAMVAIGDEGSAFVQYQVNLDLRVTFGREGKASLPTIVFAAGAATLSCATAGAVIRYTLNGHYPADSDEVPGVEVYAGPVAVASGETLRAVASKAGLGESDLLTFTAP